MLSEWLIGRGGRGRRRVAGGNCEANFALESLEPRLLLSAVGQGDDPYTRPDAIAQVSDIEPIAVIEVEAPACDCSTDVQCENPQRPLVLTVPDENSPTDPVEEAVEQSSTQDGSVVVSNCSVAYAVEDTGLLADDGVGEVQAPVEYDPSNLPSSTEELVTTLHAANPPPQGTITVSADATTAAAELGPVIQEAIRQWSNLLTSEELQSHLAEVKIGVADLPGATLAQTRGQTILIDTSAADYGWFIDLTPSDNEEFALDAGEGRLLADATSVAFGRMDLLTVLTHEIGHVLGLSHDSDLAVMTETLPSGQRVLLGDNGFVLSADADPVEAALTADSGALVGEADDNDLTFRVFDDNANDIPDVEVIGSNGENGIYRDVISVAGLYDDTVVVDMDLAAEWNLTGPNSGTLTVEGFSDLTFSGIEHLTGGGGEDTFVFVDGVSFAGTIDGGGGTNTLDYSAWTTGVTVNLAGGTATGTTGISNIQDVIGGSGNDTLTGNTKNNILVGGAGDDTYIFDADSALGNDTIIERAEGGTDTLDFSLTTLVGLNIDLSSAGPQMIHSTNLTLDLSAGDVIENVIGGARADIITGNSLDNALTGGPGNDNLIGGGGVDTVVETRDSNFTLSNTSLSIGGEVDRLSSIESARLTGGTGANTLNASTFTLGPVVLDGAGGTDTLRGGTGNDRLIGGAGNDTLTGGGGDDTYVLAPDGGTDTITEAANGGVDTVDYSAYATGITVTLGGSATGLSGKVSNIENVIGGSGNDTLTGDANANRLAGGGGTDVLEGGKGDDTYVLTPGGTVTITETRGGGTDTLDYSGYTEGVTVDLAAGTATGVSNNVADLIENVIGGSGDDILTGDSKANYLTGGPGNDTLTGGEGNDIYFVIVYGGVDTIVEGGAGGGVDKIIGPDSDADWHITGANSGTVAGTSFENIEQLIGGSGDDSFVFESGGSISGSINGGGQIFGDTIVGPDVDNTWNITGSNAGTLLSHAAFTGIENLLGGYEDDTFSFSAGGAISGLISGGAEYDGAATAPVDTLDYSALGTAVQVNLSAMRATGVGSFIAIDKVKGGTGSDTFLGPADGVIEWRITEANAGEVSGVSFEGFENLTGSDTASDAFTFEQLGSLTGIVDGGAGTFDAFRVFKAEGQYTVFNPPDTLQHTVTVNGKTIQYKGMDHDDLSAGDAFNRVISGTIFADTIIVEDIPDPEGQTGLMQVRFEGLEFYDGTTTISSVVYQFIAPSESLKVEAKDGADTIEVKSLDPLFSADLLLYGNEGGAPPYFPDLQTDTIFFSGDTFTHGGLIEVFAESITVNPGVKVSTLTNPEDLNSEGGDIVFRARRFNTADLANLSPLMINTRDVEVNIGAGAELTGAGIYLFAQAEDRSLTTLLGTNRLVNNFIIQPLLDKIADWLSLPVKVLCKQSEATITVGEGAKIIGSGTVGLYATAASDATGVAKSKYFSIGYAQAIATASVTIASGAIIQSTGAAVVVTSDANATAKMTTETAQKKADGQKQQQSDSGFAFSLAITNAKATSTTTLAAGATIEAAKTANLRAKGDIKSEAESKGSTFADGTLGLGFGLSFSDSDIHTQVDGTVIAHVDPNYLIKIEIDPTAGLNPDGTPQIGYIDYANDRIYVGGTGLVTEDVINYDSRRGTPIGGLVDDQDYVVIVVADDPNTAFDESGYIQLALTEQDAIEGRAVDLKWDDPLLPPMTMNTKAFDGSDVENERSRITLDNPAWSMSDNGVDWQLLGLTFELGQAVVYHQGTAPIEGLVDGQTYYVITGIDEFDLQGDSRWVQHQVIQLAETEMEARAGVNISFSLAYADATGFRLEAKHVLDSGLTNGVGILANLKAEDKAKAEAGIEDESKLPKVLEFLKDVKETITDFNAFETIIGKLLSLGSGTAQQGAQSAGVQSSEVKVSGAFAFCYADHDVTVDVGGTAVLKSNEDLEIKATIEHEVQLSAESKIAKPEAGTSGGSSGASTTFAGSIAVDVGVFNTDAKATVHSGAQLDALRATRVISLIQHPYITSPDEFFPSTLGEFMSSIESEGYEALSKYIKAGEKLFNTWTTAESEADTVSIAGMVNVLSFTNTAESLVESGVRINQDTEWRDFNLNPHKNNADPAEGENDRTANEQVVSIEASNYMELINMTGFFSLKKPDLKARNFNIFDLAASKSGKGGVGGALFVMLIDNTTHSTVQDGASIYSGSDGTFNMKADEALFNIDLGQAGASAGTVSVGGTVMYTGQTSHTVAQLGAGANVTGREVSIYAANLETNVMWAGGVAMGKGLGAGISVAVNDIDRTTLALIGDRTNQTPGVADDVPGIKVDEDVTARAIVGGELWAFTVAGAVVSQQQDQPTSNAPGGTDPQAGASTPQLNNQQPSGTPSTPPADTSQQQKTGIAVAAAAGVNLIKEDTQASIIDAGVGENKVEAGSLSLTAENRTRIVAATGGLAYTRRGSGGTGVSLAGAFSYNEIEATTTTLAEDTDFALDGNGIEWPTDIDEPTEVLPTVRISSLAQGKIVAAAAGGAGSVASGGTGSGGSGGSTAVAVAGSVSVNIITSNNSAAAKNANFTILSAPLDSSTGHVKIMADDTSSIFAIGGGLSLSIATGQTGGSTAVSAGIAVSVNIITSNTTTTLEDAAIVWLTVGENPSKGDLLVHAKSAETIDAYTVAGAVSVAKGTSGSGIGASGAASGSINQIDFNTQAVVRDSTVDLGTGSATVKAEDTSTIRSAAGSIAVAVGLSSSGNGGAGAFGAAFSINNIGSAGEGNFVCADVDNSQITADGPITIDTDSLATIFALAIGAAGSVTGSGSGNAIAGSLAGSASINQIRTNTQARTRRRSKLTTTASKGAAISLSADDESSIQAVAGAEALSIAVGQSTAAAVGLGFSLTINDITNTIRAAVEDSEIFADGVVTVSADSEADIDSLALGISVTVAVSGSSSAIAANATGAMSFNKIDNLIKATVVDTAAEEGSARITAGGTVSVTASDDSTIDATATAATASISGTTSATSVSVAIGLALAHNRIEKDVVASLVNVSSVLTNGNDLTVSASDTSEIHGTTFAAAVSVSLGPSTSVGIAGGASESTNIILSRTNAYIEDSTIGDEGDEVGNVDLDASGTGEIDAIIGAVAAAFSVGNTGVGVAVGVAVARNFIGWDPNAVDVKGATPSTVRNDDGTDIGTIVDTLTLGMKVRIASGALTNDIYEYIGPTVTDSDPNREGIQSFDLSIQQYRDASLWKQVSLGADAAQVQAYITGSSVWADGDLTIDAKTTESIDAVVVAAAVGVGGGTTTGVAVSAAGTYAENKIKTDVKAYIDGDGNNGIHAASVSVVADDSSGINAIAGAASLAAGFGSTTGVAVAVGLSLGFNEISNNVEAYISNADQGVTTTGGELGDITISALSQGQDLFDLNLTELGLTVADLDDAATADMDNPDDPALSNDDVTLRSDDTITGNEAVTDADEDRAILEALRAAFAANGETLAMYDIVGTAAKYSTADGSQDIREGDTVRLEKDYAGGGLEGRVYRYIVMADESEDNENWIDLSTQNYADTSTWQLVDKLKVSILVEGQSWTLAAPDGKTYVLELNETGDAISVSRNTINAVSAAASLAVGVGVGSLGIAVSGAGAVAQNVILTKTNAYSDNSVLTSDDDVTVSAGSTSKISSTVVAASLGVGGGGAVGVGASIGISIARNFIGWRPDGTETPAQVQAYLDNTSVAAVGDLTLTSVASQTINSVVIAGSVAVGVGGTVGVGVSASGVWCENKIGVDVKSYIEGDNDSNTVDISADSVTITAEDTSSIKALAGAASLAASVGGTVGVSFSIGVSLARNTITSDVEAYILDADIDAGTGGVRIDAAEEASIVATSFAASLGAGFAGIAAVSISGAGADANNIILTATNAYIENSTVESGGIVDLDASNTATIKAVVVSATASIAVGGIVGVGASIGVAVARNYIGWNRDYNYDETGCYLTGQNPDSIATGDRVKIVAGANAGNIYEYIGTETLNRPDGNNNWLVGLDYSDHSQWRLANLVKNAAEVQAYILESGVNAAGELRLDAISDQTIDATVFAGSVALSGGLVGVSLSGAGASSQNRVATLVQAYIEGEGVERIEASAISLKADDTSEIESYTGSVSVALAVGVVGGSVSIGIGLATNQISNDVEAYIKNVGTVQATGAGGIEITADETCTITSTATAASAAVGGGLAGIGVSGAGARAVNVILSTTHAYADTSNLISAGDVAITATDESTITADVTTLSAGVGVGGLGIAISIGALEAENFIGYTIEGIAQPVEVLAYVQNASVEAAGTVTVTASETASEDHPTIEAKAWSGSVSVAIGAIAVAASGAGVSVENKVNTDVEAFVIDSDVKAGGTVTIAAADESTITATTDAVSFAAAIGIGVAGAISQSFANNTIENDVEAYATNATIVTTSGTANLSITASETATITSESTASAAAVSGLFSGAVGSATSNATVMTTTRAYADPVELDIAGGVDIDAVSAAEANSTTKGKALSIAFTATSDVVAEANAIVTPTVESRLGGYADTRKAMANGTISVGSTLAASARAFVDGNSVSFSIGEARCAPVATATIAPKAATPASMISSSISGGKIVSTNGDIIVKSIYNQDLSPEDTYGILLGSGAEATAYSRAGSFIAEGGATAIATEMPYIESWVDSSATLSAENAIAVISSSATTPLATAAGQAGGFVGLGESHATATGSPVVKAHMDGTVGSEAGPGAASLEVRALSVDKAKTTAQAVSKGLAAEEHPSDNMATSTVSPILDAYIGANSEIYVSGNITVEAKENPEADASTKGVAKGLSGVGGSISTVNVTPVVTASIGRESLINQSLIKAGSVNVIASAEPTIPPNQPDYQIDSVDADNDTLAVENHNLQTGIVIEYQTDGTEIGGLEKATYTDGEDTTNTTSARQYSVIYVDDNTIALGAVFTANPETPGIGVNALTETITFAMPHNFVDGDEVIYRASATPIGGLTDGSLYTVRVIDANSIQLVAPGFSQDDMNEFAVSDVGVGSDGMTVNTITDDHDFTTGQAVTYVAPPVLTFASVQVDIDSVDWDDGVINYNEDKNNIVFLEENDAGDGLVGINHGFDNGDYVVYTVSGPGGADGIAIGGLTSGQTYRVVDKSEHSVKLAPTVSGTISFVTKDESDVDHAYITGQEWKALGFAAGQAITITGSGLSNGANNGMYVINSIDADTGRLYLTAVMGGISTTGTFNGVTVDGPTPIELVPNKEDTSVHSLVFAGNMHIGGLVSGQTYYVIVVFNEDGTSDSYQLASSYEDAMAGNAITLDTTGLRSAAKHWIGTQSIDLQPVTSGTHEFRIDLAGSLPDGAHWITGEGGVNLAELVAPAGDTVSTADAQGSAGGVYGKSKNESNSNANFIVTAYIASGSLTATGDISILAKSETNVRANTTNSTGGFVGIGKSWATTDQTSTTYAYLATGTNVVSGGDVTIDAWSNHITTGMAKAKAGGFAADVRAYMTSELSYDTQAFLEEEAKIAAAGYVGITSDANIDAVTHSYADGRGFGGGGYAETELDISPNDDDHDAATPPSTSLVTLGDGAVVMAGTAALRATTSNMDVFGDAKGYGAGFVGVSDNFADMDINAVNKVLLGSGSSLTGYRGVDLEATFNNVDTYVYSYGRVTGVFGRVDSDGNNTTTLTSSVVADPLTGTPRAQVTAGPRVNDETNPYEVGTLTPGMKVAVATGGLAGEVYEYIGEEQTGPFDLGLLDYVDTELWKQVTDATSVDYVLDHHLASNVVGDATTPNTLDQLALYVNTTNHNISIDADAGVKKRALAAGHPDTSLNNNQERTILWNADVHISSGGGAELVIDANGNITKAVGISVRTSENASQTSGPILYEPEIFVNDIGSGGAGQVYFNDAWVDGDVVGISGEGSTWEFSDSLGQVLITNYWNMPLKINNINVVNTTDHPLVDLNSKYVTLTFAIDRTASPSLVQILNEADSDIILNGTINNPIGSTVIHNSGGNITAARGRDQREGGDPTGRISLIHTAILDIRAPQGGIGSASPRVNVDMIYTDELPTVSFLPNEVCGAADALFLSSSVFFTGQLVRYTTNGTPIAGLENGKYYTVIRSADGTIQLAAAGGEVITLDPSASDAGTVHRLMPVQHVVGVANGDLYLDLKAVLRDETPVAQVTATIDSLTAGGSIDVLLQDAEQETGAAAGAGVRVTTLKEHDDFDYPSSTPADGTRDWDFVNFFRPDSGSATSKDLAAFGGTTSTFVNCIYDFRDINRQTGDRTSVAGLIAGTTTGNIIINDAEGVQNAASLEAPTVAVRGLTNLLGTGHIDVNVDGWVDLTETIGNLRVGLICSRGDDVTLTTSDALIVDALTDLGSDVRGVNITLRGLRGGIGTFMDRLEFSWSNPTDGLLHLLQATLDEVRWYTFSYDGTSGAILDADGIHLRYIGVP